MSPLAIALAGVLFGQLPVYAAGLQVDDSATRSQDWGAFVPERPESGQTYYVTSCEDDGSSGTLRNVMNTSVHDGDTVDFGQLACSTITLTNGQIETPAGYVSLIGPDDRSITISAGNTSRVIYDKFSGGGVYIRSLTIAHGYYHDVFRSANSGGCVFVTESGLTLVNTIVNDCTVRVEANDGLAAGGAIRGADVRLISSIVSGGTAIAPQGYALGGGISARSSLYVKYSSIEDNHAMQGSAMVSSHGGGIWIGSLAAATIYNSTISNNTAPTGAALYSGSPVQMIESTLSGNSGDSSAAIDARGPSLAIANSTIVSNRTALDSGYGAVHFKGPPGSSVTLQSSIFAKNTIGATDSPGDLYVQSASPSGANNIIMSINQAPPPNLITSAADPMLGPLASNGGRTKTHALLPGSPAIGTGNSSGNANDQRGPGYPRVTGPLAKSDIGSVQFDSIFSQGFDCNILPSFIGCH